MLNSNFELRATRPEDIDQIIEVCHAVYPDSYSWGPGQISAHLEIFPEGQFVVVDKAHGRPIGMAASLIVNYADFTLESKWREITQWGYFETHDPIHGKTLYGAEIMVHPAYQGKGVGKLLYQAREKLARAHKLLNIRAGARISGYHRHSRDMSARDYVIQVIEGKLSDPTLTFQIKRGFRVIGITPRYFHDPDSLNFAAVIEWLNPDVSEAKDWSYGDSEFLAAASRVKSSAQN